MRGSPRSDAQSPDELMAELASEIPGILSWALDGAHSAAVRGRLAEVPSSHGALTTWQVEADQVHGWFSSSAVETGDDSGVYAMEAYRSYTAWVSDNGHRPLSSTSFGKRLKQIVRHSRKRDGVLYHVSLGVNGNPH